MRSDRWDELVTELSFCNLSWLGGAGCPHQGTSGCIHPLVSPATPGPPCWHAAPGNIVTSHLPVVWASATRMNKRWYNPFLLVEAQWHGNIKEQFYQGTGLEWLSLKGVWTLKFVNFLRCKTCLVQKQASNHSLWPRDLFRKDNPLCHRDSFELKISQGSTSHL